MSVWTQQQLTQVRNLRVQAEVSIEVLNRHPDAMTGAHAKMARRFVADAHPLAVDIDPGDLRFDDQAGDQPWDARRVRCHWAPVTEEIELHGGPFDGDVMAVRGAPDAPLMMPSSTGLPYATALTHPLNPMSHDVRYQCSGWDENARRWVYTAP